VGYIVLKVYDDVDEGLSEISYCLHPSAWGQGYATEALQAMTEFALEGLQLHRIEAGCSAENIASWRVLEKAGYVQEGRIRQDMQVREGIWHDEFIYGILETDRYERVLR
jgi:RimJ/RimL family protein N-acetyltransferase